MAYRFRVSEALRFVRDEQVQRPITRVVGAYARYQNNTARKHVNGCRTHNAGTYHTNWTAGPEVRIVRYTSFPAMKSIGYHGTITVHSGMGRRYNNLGIF